MPPEHSTLQFFVAIMVGLHRDHPEKCNLAGFPREESFVRLLLLINLRGCGNFLGRWEPEPTGRWESDERRCSRSPALPADCCDPLNCWLLTCKQCWHCYTPLLSQRLVRKTTGHCCLEYCFLSIRKRNPREESNFWNYGFIVLIGWLKAIDPTCN